MAKFLQIGRNWLNLEQVTKIELIPNKTGATAEVRVHYTSGQHDDFKGKESIEELENFLESHKAH